MANDRIYFVCAYCQQTQMLWKFYPFGGELDGGYMADCKKMSAFLRKHLKNCHPNARMNHLSGDPCFVLTTGSPNETTAILDVIREANQAMQGKP